jgi:hypothetical protein
MSLVNNNNSVGVGNYKGVMLCNRPFAGSVGMKIIVLFHLLSALRVFCSQLITCSHSGESHSRGRQDVILVWSRV